METYEHLEVVGIQGALHSGKSTIRRYLVDHHGFTWIAMADPLKRGLMGMGATEDEVYGEAKTDPNPLWGGRTNRYAMQTLGTEWGRRMISPDIWVKCIMREIDRIYQERKSNPVRIVMDDIRFPNEAAMVDSYMGGSIITVHRPGVEYAEWKQRLLRRFGWRVGGLLGIHASERWWAIAPFDDVLYNAGSMDEFMSEIEVWSEQFLSTSET